MSEDALHGWYWTGVVVFALALWIIWYMVVKMWPEPRARGDRDRRHGRCWRAGGGAMMGAPLASRG